nr:cyclin-D4-2-like [Ipomoea trifida]
MAARGIFVVAQVDRDEPELGVVLQQVHEKAQKRLSVSMKTVFYAANYLDRFISLNKCQVKSSSRKIWLRYDD